MTITVPLLPGRYYQIFNRGNNRENIFHEERNYDYFPRLFTKYILPIADTYAYCLLKNHFHFLIRIKDDLSGLKTITGLLDPTDRSGLENPSDLKNLTGLSNRSEISKPFSIFFNAYAKAFNRAYARTGALFQRPFGRILIANQAHLVHLIAYIHQNPQKHGFVSDFREWPYSSYHVILSSEAPFPQRASVCVISRT
jgi:REP element-mobilizing transposase RayT